MESYIFDFAQVKVLKISQTKIRRDKPYKMNEPKKLFFEKENVLACKPVFFTIIQGKWRQLLKQKQKASMYKIFSLTLLEKLTDDANAQLYVLEMW